MRFWRHTAFGLALVATWAGVCSAETAAAAELLPKGVLKLPAGQPDKVPVVSGITLSPTGKLLATVGDDHLLRIWDVEHAQVTQVMVSHTDWVRAAAFRPDGQVLATAGDDHHICYWNVASGRVALKLPDEGQPVYALAFAPNGRMLAAGGFGDKVRIHDGNDGRMLREFSAPGGDICAVTFSPDSLHLAAGGRQGVIRIWQSASGQQVAELPGAGRRILALAYSPDGKLLAAGGQRRVIRLWDVAAVMPGNGNRSGTGDVRVALKPAAPNPAGGELRSAQQHWTDLPVPSGEVFSLAFCGDGSMLASGGSDNVIRLWNLRTRQEQMQLAGHTGTVATLAFGAQGQVLYSGGFDTTVRVWHWKDGSQGNLSERNVSIEIK